MTAVIRSAEARDIDVLTPLLGEVQDLHGPAPVTGPVASKGCRTPMKWQLILPPDVDVALSQSGPDYKAFQRWYPKRTPAELREELAKAASAR